MCREWFNQHKGQLLFWKISFIPFVLVTALSTVFCSCKVYTQIGDIEKGNNSDTEEVARPCLD